MSWFMSSFHFLLSEQLFPCCRLAGSLDSAGGDRFPNLTPEPLLYFIITLGEFGASWFFLFPSYCCEFSFPSQPLVLPGRSLPEDRLLRWVLPSQEWRPTLTSGAPFPFQSINHHAARIEMDRKGERVPGPPSLLRHPGLLLCTVSMFLSEGFPPGTPLFLTNYSFCPYAAVQFRSKDFRAKVYVLLG